jgi:hypothetical protein
MKRRLATAVLLCAASTAGAQDFHAQGFLEARLPVADGEDRSWTEGGLGKMRFGDGNDSLQVAGAVSLSWQMTESLLAVADLQAQGQTSPELGVLSAYLRWRPVSTSPWRWSLRAGAFFPPVSLENDGIGWTSRWTLTPSALNSWIGEELRTIGAEARLEHRGTYGSFEIGVAAFRWNDPAGELIFSRGWALGDVTSPLGARVRQPDAYSDVFSPVPVEYKPFVENDGRTGWHADAEWRSPRGIRLRALRYDNRAEPDTYSHQAGRDVFSWQTRFGSVGAEVPLGGAVIAAQWLEGSTIIEPVARAVHRKPFSRRLPARRLGSRRLAAGAALRPLPRAAAARLPRRRAGGRRACLDGGTELAPARLAARHRGVAARRQHPRPAPAGGPGAAATRGPVAAYAALPVLGD